MLNVISPIYILLYYLSIHSESYFLLIISIHVLSMFISQCIVCSIGVWCFKIFPFHTFHLQFMHSCFHLPYHLLCLHHAPYPCLVTLWLIIQMVVSHRDNLIIKIKCVFFCLPDLPVIVCNTAELECKNGRCVPESWVCDGEDDCGDRTDENNCDPGQFQIISYIQF